ncbi:FAD-dependent oxidoreductase [Mycolicibacterium grossiae]|uniref:Pyridine nucleotide-disulfide oxidoreductase n=1 Tax=Mycolicibacterium grossiae TaxID=1552759 RepID=A0A1E8Q8X9_9MYCO|nr:FAD-dependent oxidoreductase [Mycolicibacterium grossiae]OFJ54424.1 pyridine nucleotide-disulfide oxidoreductase [Mycolicibacterium grossiae]
MSPLDVVVVGAGAWGLPAAAELARRGHRVTLVDRYGPANDLSSSRGPTRLWRLADPDPARVRLSMRGLDAMRRLTERAGEPVYLTRGMLWRDDESLPPLLATLDALGVEHTAVSAADVDRFFPGLRPDGRDAVWQPVAGVVLAAVSLRAQLRLFQNRPDAMLLTGDVVGVEATASGVRVDLGDGRSVQADAAVLAPGPGAAPLLAGLGIDVALHPYLEQVVHFGDPAAPHAGDDLPGLFDGPVGDRPGIYAMPTPGVGYKVGLDRPLRDYAPGDVDRTPDAGRTAVIRERVAADLRAVTPTVLDEQVCSWTDSPDGRFVIDRLEGPIVLACGDSGEGFKFSALMGEVLADLVEDRPVDADVGALSRARFAGGVPDRAGPHVLGRH